MNKFCRLGVGLVIGIALLTGCGEVSVAEPENVTQDSIYVNKEGAMTVYLIEDFDKDYYKLSELSDMAGAEVDEYVKQNGEGSVACRAFDILDEDGKKVRAIYDYKSCDDYNKFNDGEESFFYGKVSQVDTDIDSAKSIKDGVTIADKTALADKHIIITDEKLIIYCPYNVTYLSEGAIFDAETHTVDTTGCDGQTIIIMNK